MNFGERHHSTQSVQVSAGLVLEVTLRAPLSSWVGSHHPLYSLLTHSFIHSFLSIFFATGAVPSAGTIENQEASGKPLWPL